MLHTSRINVTVMKIFYYILQRFKWPFVNLGIGIGIENGIGTDITNAIISSSIRPMAPQLAGWSLWRRGPHLQSHVTL